MKRTVLHFLSLLTFLSFTMSTYAQTCPGATRDVSNSKSGTANDAIGIAMRNFFADGGSATWRFEAGAKFVENTDGTAKLTGVIAYYDKPTRRFQVDINFIGQTFVAPAGSPVLFNTNPSTAGWYYYYWGASSLTGLGDLAGAKVNLSLRGKPLQVGIGAEDVVQDVTKFGASGWFSWSVVSQPTNTAITINPFPANPSVDQADISISLSGNPTTCGDPCATDTQKPVLLGCPSGNIPLTTSGTCATADWTAPTATDNCSTPTLTFATSPTVGLTKGGCFPIGVTTVTYTATDAKGNTATCAFTVTVTKVNNPCDNDTDKPVLTGCPTDQILTLAAGTSCKVATWTAPTATDNCGGVTVTLASSSTTLTKSGDCFPIGKITFTYTATDTKGNTATCSFFIMVSPPADPCATDITKPVITNCPTNQTVTADAGTTCKTVSWTAPSATDNCTLQSFNFVTSPTASLTNPDCYPVGTTTVTYTATDAKGNTATCVFTITVNPPPDPCTTDNTRPVITNCPTSQTVTADLGATCKTTSWVAPSATDNCALVSLNFVTSPTSSLTNPGCYPVGTTTVTYTATDAKGNTATCVFTITVNPNPCDVDVSKPVITNCPANQTTVADLGATCKTTSWTAPTATDNCTLVSLNFVTSPTAGLTNPGCYPKGVTTTVTYTATDAKGNTATCVFTITVNPNPCEVDVTKPVISNCPANIAATSGGSNNNCRIIDAWTPPTATDNCSTPVLTFTTSPEANIPNGGCFPRGVTTVVYTATDAKGNTATCSFTVTITGTCTQIINPGVIKGDEEFCPGGPIGSILEESPANGGTGAIEYMWMYSTTSSTFNAGWTAVPNSNTKDLLTLPALTRTTYFIRCVRRAGCDDFKESNVVIKKATAYAEIKGPFSACTGADVTFEGLDLSPTTIHTWLIDDATISTSNDRIIKFKFTTTGQKRVRYEAYYLGCSQKITRFVDVKSCLLGSGAIDNFNLVVNNTHAVKLDWVTSNEKLASMYVVESSADGKEFTKVADVPAQIKQTGIYTYTDLNPKMGRSFYRIKHIENDGNITYTVKKQSVIYINGGDKVMAYPNPTANQIFFEVLDVENTEGVIEVYNEMGKMVKTINFAKNQTRYELNTSELPVGLYIAKIRSANNDVKTIKFNRM
jgi:hypothetical protein